MTAPQTTGRSRLGPSPGGRWPLVPLAQGGAAWRAASRSRRDCHRLLGDVSTTDPAPRKGPARLALRRYAHHMPLETKRFDVRRFDATKMQKINLFETPRFFCDIYCLEPGQTQKPHRH
jgi:hypothetical protein